MVARVVEGAEDAQAAFAHGTVGQADHVEAFALGRTDFEEYVEGIEAVDGGGMNGG